MLMLYESRIQNVNTYALLWKRWRTTILMYFDLNEIVKTFNTITLTTITLKRFNIVSK
jgi:hypothetical protein